jgi:hypothetical protein
MITRLADRVSYGRRLKVMDVRSSLYMRSTILSISSPHFYPAHFVVPEGKTLSSEWGKGVKLMGVLGPF